MPRIAVGLTPTSKDLVATSIAAGVDLEERLAKAVPFYLAGRGAEIGGWAYPEFRRDNGQARTARFEVEVDGEVWTAFQAEAEREGISVEQLFEHAALYFAAAHDVSADSRP